MTKKEVDILNIKINREWDKLRANSSIRIDSQTDSVQYLEGDLGVISWTKS